MQYKQNNNQVHFTVQLVQNSSPWYGWIGSCDLVWSTTLTLYECTYFVKKTIQLFFYSAHSWQNPSMIPDCRTFRLHRFPLTVCSFVLPTWPKHPPISDSAHQDQDASSTMYQLVSMITFRKLIVWWWSWYLDNWIICIALLVLGDQR